MLRAATHADVDAVCAVARAADTEDIGRPWLMLTDIARAWQLPGFDVRRDAWVVEDAGTVVAGAWLVIQPGA
ncbi:MAG: hypothetical protein JWN32_4405, partial [Solirubrobacterales bacterium]|nr:hypothetical protein [Solirubrobacterales bacterium]